MEPNAPRRHCGRNGVHPGWKLTGLQQWQTNILGDTANRALLSKAYALQNGIWTLESQLNMVSDPNT